MEGDETKDARGDDDKQKTGVTERRFGKRGSSKGPKLLPAGRTDETRWAFASVKALYHDAGL